MAKIDQEFKTLCETIFREGRTYTNENRGVERLQIPSYTFRHLFTDGFPLLGLKYTEFKDIIGELIWFLRGDTDIEFLNKRGIKIWNKDAYNWYVKHYDGIPEFILSLKEFSAQGKGSVGRNYSAQWRDFFGVDQIQELIDGMIKDIMSSRLKVNAWNPAELGMTALPPCHSEFQVIGVPLTLNDKLNYLEKVEGVVIESDYSGYLDGITAHLPNFGFELHWNQRSVDTFLGLPFNIASYGLLALILQKCTGYIPLAIEGTLKCVHFYDNQYNVARELIDRDPNYLLPCTVDIVGVHKFSDVMDMDICNVITNGYESYSPLKVPMLAPKKL